MTCGTWRRWGAGLFFLMMFSSFPYVDIKLSFCVVGMFIKEAVVQKEVSNQGFDSGLHDANGRYFVDFDTETAARL